MLEILSASFVLNGGAFETVFDLVKLFLGWLYELLGQKRALQGRHANPKPEAGKGAEIENGNVELIVYRTPGR